VVSAREIRPLNAPWFHRSLYDAWLFDAPKLLDLAALYGNDSVAPSVRTACWTMLRRVFEWEPRFLGDLASTIGSVAAVRSCVHPLGRCGCYR
jgi:hypothetical protein